ncbi:50S ribosomal protein L32 [Candidatus Nomurabacteria bacterium RIFCSPHIGHO2_01_FULL_40_20]|uniref:Large ribosomal subunit protein bL32 n=1 Tax=Candidatus Nomurabacteria bacterium RIFCSPHIGHO2_01_FULL_40_20 TaxID=1801738 RepID=A0A1F6V241_9BACT|nr:MAG: 50S ribosomal protein L32 [Candidatus Nomurabacteria bacterium RIFCSPHIGHO2_01_FULL_40_20]
MRHTKSHTANRRSHHALVGANFMKCSNCGAKKPGHIVCASCGFYNGKKVLDLVKKTEKKLRRQRGSESRSESSGQKKAKAKKAEESK